MVIVAVMNKICTVSRVLVLHPELRVHADVRTEFSYFMKVCFNVKVIKFIPEDLEIVNSLLDCEDNLSWTDYKYGDGKGRCVDMTLDYCNNVDKYKDTYTTEARKNCPRSCGLCK